MSPKQNLPRGLIVTSTLVITLWGVYAARPFLIPVCMAALVAFTMAPLVRLLRRYYFPEWFAIGFSSLLLVLPILSFGYVVVRQGGAFLRDLPFIMESLNQFFLSFLRSEFAKKLENAFHMDMSTWIRKLEGGLGEVFQIAIAGLGAIVDAGLQLFLVLLFAILMLANRDHLHRNGTRILEESLSVRNPKIIEEVVSLIEEFLIVRFLIVILVGLASTVFFLLFKLQYAILFGGLMGLVTLIPSIGFFIGLIPAIIVAVGMGFPFLKTSLLILALLVMNIFESNFITPKILGRKLNINLLATFIGLFAGGLFWGMWGMFLSIPLLGVLRITFSAAPSLRPWGDLFAEKETKTLLKKSAKDEAA